MKIYSWNVNGLRAVLKKGFKEWINEEKPDILCIQETKIQKDQLEENVKNIEGYHSYFSFAEKKGYSGVAIYTRNEPVEVKIGIGIDKFDNEGRILQADFDNFILLNVYFPNGQMNEDRLKYKMDFNESILQYCNELVNKGKKVIICGDYNIAHTEMDIKNAKSNEKTSGFLPEERVFLDKFLQNGFTDSYRYFNPDKIEYSWWSYMFKSRERNTGWRIDYHLVSNNFLEQIKNASILNEVYGSDHCPVMIEVTA